MMNWLHPVVRRPRIAKVLKVLLLLICISGLTPSVFAQIIDKGEYVEIVKGTQLCSNVSLKQKKDISHPGRVFWKVTSNMRPNGTQTVSAFLREAVYDRLTGDTTSKVMMYDEDYAVLFKQDPAHKDMVFLISPKDGGIEETVEVCRKEK